MPPSCVKCLNNRKGVLLTFFRPRRSVALPDIHRAGHHGRVFVAHLDRAAIAGLARHIIPSWFGDLWTIESKKLNETVSHRITVNVPRVAGGDLDLPHKKVQAPANLHQTIIEIRALHRKLTGRTLGKVKNHLRSLYRRDISKGWLILKVNDEQLDWDAEIDEKLLTRRDGSKAKKLLDFKVGKKTVTGWAAVLEKGSRRSAGFSIMQADRVITGWPDSYRPETIFGEGGSNDLVNQRLFGELILEGFEVSHTKDKILFEDGQQEDLEAKLKNELADLRQLALSHRKGADERIRRVTDAQRDSALNSLEDEIKSPPIQTFFKTFELPSESLIKKSNEAVKDSVVSKKINQSQKTKIGSTTVSVYLVKDMSPNDPYVIIESTKSKTSVIVIINLAHPHLVRNYHVGEYFEFYPSRIAHMAMGYLNMQILFCSLAELIPTPSN